MKINQLFIKRVDQETLKELLKCFGLKDLNDKHMFSKYDMMQYRTSEKVMSLKPTLAQFYLPCKARVYLENITDKRALTIFKQVLRLFGYHLSSKEKNVNGSKIIFYRLTSDAEVEHNPSMQRILVRNTIHFD